MSFSALAPNAVQGLIPNDSLVKTNAKMNGLSNMSQDLTAAGFCSREDLAKIGKVSLHFLG